MWKAKGRTITKECESDFAEAVRIYTLAVKAGKVGATLRCANMAFPPSDKYADREIVYRRVKGKDKPVGKRMILPRQFKVTMGSLNRKGIWWCPFCAKLRRFERFDGFISEGTIVNEPVMMCPMCNVSHMHGTVQKYNPYASRGAGRRTRSDKGLSRG